MIVQEVIQIVGGIKLFSGVPHICAQCLLYQLTSHTLYATSEKFITIVDKFKDADTMLQINDALHLLVEWAEKEEILIKITL